MGKQLFLIGYMAAGKSTAAAELAQRTHLPLLDLDAALEARHEKPIADLFAAVGEADFRRMESAILEEIAGNSAHRIIACGGGLACTPGAIERMKQHGRVVWLNTPFDVIFRRLSQMPEGRPLLNKLGWPEKSGIEEHFRSRQSCYEKADDAVTELTDEVLSDWANWLLSDQS